MIKMEYIKVNSDLIHKLLSEEEIKDEKDLETDDDEEVIKYLKGL